MKAVSFLVTVGLAYVAARAVSAAAPAANHHPTYLRHLMKDIISVQTQAIWDVGNNAQDADGNPDASKIRQLTGTASSGQVVKSSRPQFLAQADHVTAAGEAIEDKEDPGAFNAQRVQSTIGAKPAAFRAFVAALAASMDEVLTAARAKDAMKLAHVSGRLDEVCENCHKQFWYPEQATKPR